MSGVSLRVVRTGNLIKMGADHDSGAHKDLTVYRPLLPIGYFWVGLYAQGNYGPLSGETIMVKPLTEDAVAAPLGFTRVWDDHGSGKKYDYSCWRPNPPVGYKALGYIMRLRVENQDPPSGTEIEGLVCVHESLVTEARIDALEDIWDDAGSGADWDCSIWRIVPIDPDMAINSGTFYGQRFNRDHNPNPPDPPVYCLGKNKVLQMELP